GVEDPHTLAARDHPFLPLETGHDQLVLMPAGAVRREEPGTVDGAAILEPDRGGGSADVDAEFAGERCMEAVHLRHALAHRVDRAGEVAGDLLAGEGGKLHRTVFGEDQEFRPLLRRGPDPEPELADIAVPAVMPFERKGGGGDLHGASSGVSSLRRRIQNWSCLSVSSASP